MLLESSRDLSPLAAVTCSHTGCPFTEYRARVTLHSAVVDVSAECDRVFEYVYWLAVLVVWMTSCCCFLLMCYSSHRDSDPYLRRCFRH